jgi:Ca-activated chloride channel homolog
VTQVTWEQPSALWLLLAILLLLFARSTIPQQRLTVANLFLWADLESRKASALSRRLRRHWLLLLQAAFVAVVVVTLARPLVSFGGHRIAIVLDVSMSMGAIDGEVTRLETAKTRARSLVENLPRGGRATIWLAGSDVAMFGEFARGDPLLERELQPLRPTDAAANLDIAIARARTADAAVSRIHVVSDTAPRDSRGIIWAPVGARADNAAITALVARRNVGLGTMGLLVAVRNFGATVVAGEVVITREASVVARRTLHLPAAAESNVVFELPDGEGVVVARFALADALAADNTRFAVIDRAAPLRALLIGRNHWVEQALAANPDVLTVVAGSAQDGDGTEPDLVICASCADVPPASSRAGVLLMPAPSASPHGPAAVVVINGTHPLLQGLNADGALVSPVGSAAPGEGAEVLARAATLPVIVAQERGLQRIVELRIDPSASGITGEVTFPLFLANAVEWLAEAKRRPTMLVAGDPLRLALGEGAGEEIVITAPDGRNVPARRVGGELVAAGTAVAGIYHVRVDDRELDFVVNPAVEQESDLLISPPEATPTAPVALDAQRDPASSTHGLLLGALALLALEWRHRIGRQRG